ncbi:MAG: hypothetical protein ACMXYC_01155 [Candidatus Woesearchaeota archaeon]
MQSLLYAICVVFRTYYPISIRTLSDIVGVPKSTLFDYLKTCSTLFTPYVLRTPDGYHVFWVCNKKCDHPFVVAQYELYGHYYWCECVFVNRQSAVKYAQMYRPLQVYGVHNMVSKEQFLDVNSCNV